MAKSPNSHPFIFYRYALKEHIGPFFFALSLIVFLFLMNYTLREAHRLFGRGLDPIIIFKMFYYHLAPTLALAVPMSVLVATVMSFVRISADSEITILRSSGVSLNRIIFPIFLASIGVAISVYYFNNTILPEYNVESSKLASEIRRLKPTATIYENTFTKIKSFSLYVEKLDDNFNNHPEKKIKLLGKDKADYPVDHLFGVIIYDNKDPQKPRTIIADEGFVYLNPQRKIFEFILTDGEIYELTHDSPKKFQHSFFQKTKIIMPADDHVMEDVESEEKSYKSNRQKTSDELTRDIAIEKKDIAARLTTLIHGFSSKRLEVTDSNRLHEKRQHQLQPTNNRLKKQVDLKKTNYTFMQSYNGFKEAIKRESSATESVIKRNSYTNEEIYDLEGEWYKKYSIPFASILFVLIGAPLGMMTRKGETGNAGFICLLVFIVYYVCLILGEELSEEGVLTPFIGIWSGNIFGLVMATISYFLLKREQSMADFIDLSRISAFFKRFSK